MDLDCENIQEYRIKCVISHSQLTNTDICQLIVRIKQKTKELEGNEYSCVDSQFVRERSCKWYDPAIQIPYSFIIRQPVVHCL